MEAGASTNRYDDIMDLPHWQSTTRPRMSRLNRAAQFAPFAALTGHDAAILETGRLTDVFKELDEDRKVELDEKLRYLAAHLREEPYATIKYFCPDEKKEGGTYLSAANVVIKVDAVSREVIMRDKLAIPVDLIFAIELENQ